MPFVYSILNLWREPKAHRDGSVPGWLEIGTMALMPPIAAESKLQSVTHLMPPQIRTSTRLFPTIERGNGYVNLKIGQYALKHSKKKRGKGTIDCLQVVEHKAIDQILIHDALRDSSTTLEGCIGPGLTRKPSPGQGILDSAEAMKEIFKLLGGYSLGTRATLNVWSNVPGETRTKLTWARIN
ncbi:MAG: DUF5675 family protein [Pseudomonadota bacterium]